MSFETIIANPNFVGRDEDRQLLIDIAAEDKASIVIIYGRRRVGKTELIEQTYRSHNILKFEGVQGQSSERQMQLVMQKLAEYGEQPLLRDVKLSSWRDVFKYIYKFTATTACVLYFEELQWLANYQADFISYLKYAWDNDFRHNKHLVIVLCGSSPSFMINEVVHSKALYNRSQTELPLTELSLSEARALLKKSSINEVMDAYLTVGGVPEYLLRLKKYSSVRLSLANQAFKKQGFFAGEYQRIFISNMSDNPYYKAIIEFLSKRKFATRADILASLKIKGGGTVSDVMRDLVLCGFIEKYTPYNASEEGRLQRYCISDAYLQFYFKFVKPISKDISLGKYQKNPLAALRTDIYYKWLGFAFERFCRRYHYLIADILKFSGVNYQAGAYYNRSLEKQAPGFQIDLLFDRDDKVITVCEIKYLQKKVSTRVIAEFEKKIELMGVENKTLHKVLICANGAEQGLLDRGYFDDVVTLEDLFAVS